MDFFIFLINAIVAGLQYGHYAQTGSKVSRFFFVINSMMAGLFLYRMLMF